MLYLKEKILTVLVLASFAAIPADRAVGAPPITVATEPIAVPTFTFSRNLGLGDSGSDVVWLQFFLEQKGYLVMPAGVAKGYFGPITRAALAAWQRASGISPCSGYLGPISRAKINATVLNF